MQGLQVHHILMDCYMLVLVLEVYAGASGAPYSDGLVYAGSGAGGLLYAGAGGL